MIHRKTLRNKKNKYNRRRKTNKLYKGGNIESNKSENKEPSGVFGDIGEKIQDVGENAIGYIANKGARLLGYKPIQESEKSVEEVIPTSDVEIPSIQIPSAISETTENVLNNVNEVLQSPQVAENIERAAEETKEITEELLNKINKPFDDPQFEEKLTDATENLADVANIVIDAADEPINKAIDKANESFYKMGSAAATSSVKIATDVLATIPGLGVIFDVARLVNDGSKALTSVSEAGSELIQTGSDIIGETSKNLDKIFMDKMKEKGQIQNRIMNSTSQFNTPISNIQEKKGGNKKTRRFLKRRKMKSKRVRFAV